MKTAVITGASAGLGLEFVRQLENFFPEIDCVWLISRSEEKLREASLAISSTRVRLLPLDLCREESLSALAGIMAGEKPDIYLLVNNAGCGYLGNVGETDYRIQTRMTDLNVRALTAVTAISAPYMARGGRIINLSSIASFCPNPRMDVYSASKAYVSSFSRGLGEELGPHGIKVTAVCPGPMATDFLDTAKISGNSKMFATLPYCDPAAVVHGAYSASRAGRAVYTPKGFYKLYRVIAKIFPQKLMVKFTKT